MFEKNKNKQSAPPPRPAVDESAHSKPSTTPSAPARKTAMIGSTIKITGDVTGDEDLVIDGQVEGEIKINSHQVTVGKSGQVKANVTAKNIKIEGSVRGDITGNEKVVIANSGNVRGNIVAPRVTLEDGAVFKGSIDMDPSDAKAAQLPLSNKEASTAPPPEEQEKNFALKSG